MHRGRRGMLYMMRSGTRPIPGPSNSDRDAASNVVARFEYNASGQMTSSTNASGTTRYVVYDAVGNQTDSWSIQFRSECGQQCGGAVRVQRFGTDDFQHECFGDDEVFCI